jgi:hypothetical protein
VLNEAYDRVEPWTVQWIIETPDGEVVFWGNIALTVGLREVMRLIAGAGGVPYNNANAQIGVGDSATAPAVGQTGLLGANQHYVGMDAGFPIISADGLTITFRSTFAPAAALFNWQEFAVRNGGAGAVVLNRRTQNVGVKPSAAWRVSVLIRAGG